MKFVCNELPKETYQGSEVNNNPEAIDTNLASGFFYDNSN
jgi:hypothetical protein